MDMAMAPAQCADWLMGQFEGLIVKASYGEQAFFYNPGAILKNGVYFATIKEADGPADKASRLSRPGVWRLNFALSSNDFAARFGPRPARPPKGGVIEGAWDFAAADQLMPHPIYGWMGWVCVICPTFSHLDRLQPALADSHARAAKAFEKRTRAF